MLAGIIGGLLARGVDPLVATAWGVWLHGEAGKAAAADYGPAGFLARDLLPHLPRLMAASSSGRPDPLEQPIEPMEAKLVAALPDGEHWQFEPKWDGFRAIAVRDGDRAVIWSKSGKTLGRYFPEIEALLLSCRCPRFVVDGEIVVPLSDHLSFGAPAGAPSPGTEPDRAAVPRNAGAAHPVRHAVTGRPRHGAGAAGRAPSSSQSFPCGGRRATAPAVAVQP